MKGKVPASSIWGPLSLLEETLISNLLTTATSAYIIDELYRHKFKESKKIHPIADIVFASEEAYDAAYDASLMLYAHYMESRKGKTKTCLNYIRIIDKFQKGNNLYESVGNIMRSES
jgi:hypothetical protein